MSLTLDGLTGSIQEMLRAKHEVSAYHMMFAVNVFAAVYLSVAVVVSGEIWRAATFIHKHPEVLISIALFGLCSAVGQVTLGNCKSIVSLEQSNKSQIATCIFSAYEPHSSEFEVHKKALLCVLCHGGR